MDLLIQMILIYSCNMIILQQCYLTVAVVHCHVMIYYNYYNSTQKQKQLNRLKICPLQMLTSRIDSVL